MFKNLKIPYKLGLGFFIIILIFSIAGFIAIVQMSYLSTTTKEIYDHPYKKTKASLEVQANIFAMHRSMKDIVLSRSSDELDRAISDVNTHEDMIIEEFEIIKTGFLGDKVLYESAYQAILDWRPIRAEVIQNVKEKKYAEAAVITKTKGNSQVQLINEKMDKLTSYEENLVETLVDGSVKIRNSTIFFIGLLFILSVTAGAFIAYLFIRSVTIPIGGLIRASDRIADGDLETVEKKGSASGDEIGMLENAFSKMSEYLKTMVLQANAVANGDYSIMIVPRSEKDTLSIAMKIMTESLKNNKHINDEQFWLKDGLNKLAHELYGNLSPERICNISSSFIGRYVNAGMCVFYIYNAEPGLLMLEGSYAYTEKSNLSDRYKLGEGVVGQAALEKKPIFLKNIRQNEIIIPTGTSAGSPLNTYTLPIVFEDELLGIIEIASFESMSPAVIDFLTSSNSIIANYLYSSLQNNKIKELLKISEEATGEAQRKSAEIQAVNTTLEEQQQQLQQQSEELQQTNSLLEEQQQQLQQQSEELQQSNDLLKEQQEQLETRAEQLKENNEILSRSKIELEGANKYKSQFLANMSHELRTPLNSIILLSSILSRNEKNTFSVPDIERLKVIYQSGNELLRLINDILDLSKIESGKISLQVSSFDSRGFVKEFKSMFSPLAIEKELDFAVKDNIKGSLVTDKDKLSQIVRNFLSNAFKFTKKGGVKLILDKRDTPEYPFSVSVTDSGEGIPKNKQEIIFEAFQQVDGSISRQYGGTGLGLSIARELAALIRGKITIDSEKGSGSTFSILFPILDAGRENSKPVQERAAADVQTAGDLILDDRDNIAPLDTVIMIIDDDRSFVLNLLEVLHKKNLKVLFALNGKDGMEMIKRYRPQGILLDLILPDTDGFNILRDLKSTRELEKIPVMIISGKDKDENYSRSGAFDYIEKPVNLEKFELSLNNMLSKPGSKSKINKILLVEDNEVLRKALHQLLSKGNTQISEAVSREEALEKINESEFNLAIIDLGLKEGNGFEICKIIKEKKLNLPVLIYTGKNLTADQEKTLKKYSESIIIKTVHSDIRLMEEADYFLNRAKESNTQNSRRINTGSGAERLDLREKTILIVDDDIKNVFVLTSALEDFNAKILDAQNGKEALKLLNTQKVDLVLMDIMMPEMDGYQTTREIRKNSRMKEIPIIALTAKALAGDREKCLEAGADDYITKPIDYDGLIHLIGAWIEKKREKQAE